MTPEQAQGGDTPSLERSIDDRPLPPPQALGVDDEVLKTAMAVYNPDRRFRVHLLKNLKNEDAQQDYLEPATTLRGVTIISTAFLGPSFSRCFWPVPTFRWSFDNGLKGAILFLGWSKLSNKHSYTRLCLDLTSSPQDLWVPLGPGDILALLLASALLLATAFIKHPGSTPPEG